VDPIQTHHLIRPDPIQTKHFIHTGPIRTQFKTSIIFGPNSDAPVVLIARLNCTVCFSVNWRTIRNGYEIIIIIIKL